MSQIIASGTPSAADAASQVELLLSRIESLPTLPVVATRLLELTSDDRSSAREVIELIESDQSLSARVLKAAGRADMGARVNTIQQAVVLLGFDAVQALVLSIQIFDTFPSRVENPPGETHRFDRQAFWKHSLATGCAAGLLAEALPAPPRGDAPAPKREEAFICGLLHDIGKVVLDACFPKSYDRVIQRVEALRTAIADCERGVFGIDHTLAGKRLAAHWRLPAMIRESIWLHHHTPTSTPTRIAYPLHVQVVQLADRLVRHMRIGYSGNHATESPLAESATALGLTQAGLDKVLAALPEALEERARAIGLDNITSKGVYQEALADANAELSRANQSLAALNRKLQQRSRGFEALRLLTGAASEHCLHEAVCGRAARALALVLPERRWALFATAAARRGLIVAGAGEPDEPVLDIIPAPESAAMPASSGLRDSWYPAHLLPAPLLERLADLLGETCGWWWPIRGERAIIGGIVLGEVTPPRELEALTALAEGFAAGLLTVDARLAAEGVSEEMAEMNRRLVAATAEMTRMRSLAMVGEMAAGAAHELNNPLAVISGRAQLLSGATEDADAQRHGNLIAEHAHRASAIVNELMEFAKPAAPRPEAVDLTALLGEIRREWIEKGALTSETFVLDLPDYAPLVYADPGQVRKLFDELIRNSVDAMGQVDRPGRLIVNCRTDLSDDRVVIRLQDNGVGMEPEVAERAMTPFYSHKPAGRGRGLGLSRAVRYADINGGSIRLASSAGEGTAAFVELPRAAGS